MYCCYLLIFVFRLVCLVASDNFIVSFSNPRNWSKEEWVEFTGNIPSLKEFTTCHWEKLMYFPENFTPVWSFCVQMSVENKDIKCVGVFSKAIHYSANRDIIFGGWFQLWGNTTLRITVKIQPYRHRTWNHFCWSYSSLNGSNKFYYNGKLIEEIMFNDKHEGFVPPTITSLSLIHI